MNSIMEHAAKRLVYAGVIFILLTISAYSAEGSPITFTGSTQGAFNNGAFGSTAALNGLTFTGVTFVANTNKFGQGSVLGPSFIVGYFTLTSLTGFTATDTFSLQLNVDPSGGWSPDPMIVQASLFPNLQTNVLAVNFNGIGGGPPFSFSNGIYTGTGYVSVFSGNLDPGQINVPIYGYITFTSVTPPVPTPEPSTLLLLGTGITGMALRFARKGTIGRNRNCMSIGQ